MKNLIPLLVIFKITNMKQYTDNVSVNSNCSRYNTALSNKQNKFKNTL